MASKNPGVKAARKHRYIWCSHCGWIIDVKQWEAHINGETHRTPKIWILENTKGQRAQRLAKRNATKRQLEEENQKRMLEEKSKPKKKRKLTKKEKKRAKKRAKRIKSNDTDEWLP